MQKTTHIYTPHDGSRDQIFSTVTELKSKGKKFLEKGRVVKRTTIEPLSHALQLIKKTISDIVTAVEADSYELYLTSDDKSNFRFGIAKTLPYKGNRTAPRPQHYGAIRDYLIEYHWAKVICGEEADDAMGARQSDDTVIVSIDKDMWQIPGRHYNFVTHESQTIDELGYLRIAENRRKLYGGGDKWFFAQMLLGDSADNIPGVAGYGPVNTFDLLYSLKSFAQLKKVVYAIYKEVGIVDRFLEVAQLLWIRHKHSENIVTRLGE